MQNCYTILQSNTSKWNPSLLHIKCALCLFFIWFVQENRDGLASTKLASRYYSKIYIMCFSHQNTTFLHTPLAELIQPQMGLVLIKLNTTLRWEKNHTLNHFVLLIATKKFTPQNSVTGSVCDWASLKLRSHLYV